MQKSISSAIRSVALLLAPTSAAFLLVAGCQTPGAANKVQTQPSGSQLWAENCGRCHNIRSPSEFSDAQWDVVAFHMRVRANLTAEEHRSILEFLQASN